MGFNEIIFFSLFIVFIVGMLMLDLGVFGKKKHVISFKEAASWSAVWLMFTLVFYMILDTHGDLIHGINNYDELVAARDKYAKHVTLFPDNYEASLQSYRDNMSLEFITGYFVEYALSVDNIFVIILIFTAFGVREKYYKEVLLWGILGAICMRFIFIFTGAALMNKYEWIIYIFGGFLVFTGIKMYLQRNQEEKIDTSKHPLIRFVSKYFPVYPKYVNDKFFVKVNNKWSLTPLFLVLLMVEFTDLIFAVDSVPAVFSVTKDPYIVFFSNIFAILGLRSMFFFLTNIMHLFHYLKIGLSILLVFIGGKMIFHSQLEAIGFQTTHSLFIILGILALSVILSLVFPKKEVSRAVYSFLFIFSTIPV
ncbi:MAG TPA: TerC/Alx family metal homeostasis membrane protein [Cytophagales bacterium]|nr:TerC/Alx family metal homeostasis membrane protein [Cytophagales bacterium]